MAGADTYYFGECTWYVASSVDWVQGHWGNATDWCAGAQSSGLQTGAQAVAGAVVVYAAGDGYSAFGHVAIVRDVYGDGSFLVSEMNYVAWDTVDERVSNGYDVECFIYGPGMGPGQGAPPPGGGGSSTPQNVAQSWAVTQSLFNDKLPDFINRYRNVHGALERL